MENGKKYIFHIKYRDIKIGCLAYVEGNFYLALDKDSEEAGVCFIPAFELDEIYKSTELFNFFKNRIDTKNSVDTYEALTQYAGTVGRDNYSLEELPDRLVENKIQTLLEAYEIQEKKRKIQSENREETHSL